MTRTRSTTTRRLVLATAAIAAFGVAAPVQSALAQPKPNVAQHSVARHKQHDDPRNCADSVRDLTERYKQAGMTGQAAHVAAELTLGC
jgi:hypothetical protein